MTAAQNSIAWQGSRRLMGPMALAAVGLMVAVVGVAISARIVAAPATTAGHVSAPLTLGHDEHATSAGAKSIPLTAGHDEHATTVSPASIPLTSGHDEHATSAGPLSVPLTSGHDEHVQSQPALPTVPLGPRGGGSNRAQ